MKLRLLLTIISCNLFFFNASSQLIVYNTYNDYKDNKGDLYDDSYHYFGISGSDAFGGYIVFFKSSISGKKIDIKCGKVWGFKYKTTLFRISAAKYSPEALFSKGKMCFYKNGYQELQTMDEGGYVSVNQFGGDYYISKDLQSDMIILLLDKRGKPAKTIRQFRDEHPETNDIFKCINEPKNTYEDILDCIKKLNKP